MARRFNWVGGSALGDIAAALAGRSFGEAYDGAVALNTSAAGFTPDCSKGETFYCILATATKTRTVTINNPINGGDGSKIKLILPSGTATGASFTFGTLYRNAPFTNWKPVAGQTSFLEFEYIGSQGVWQQTRLSKNVLNL